MKLVLTVLAAALTLFGQVILVETTDWGINYLNAHPHGLKPLPLMLGIVSSLFFAYMVTSSVLANRTLAPGERKIVFTKPAFWGFLALSLFITFGINLMLE